MLSRNVLILSEHFICEETNIFSIFLFDISFKDTLHNLRTFLLLCELGCCKLKHTEMEMLGVTFFAYIPCSSFSLINGNLFIVAKPDSNVTNIFLFAEI